MPDFRETLKKAREEEAQKTQRKVTKGIRPDRILRGEIQFGNNGQIVTESKLSLPTSEVERQSNSTVLNTEQSRSKPVSQPGTNPEQSRNKVGTNKEQRKPRKIETRNKPVSQPGTQPGTKSEQSRKKAGTNHGFLSLVGLQKRIVLFIYDLCRSKGERSTGSVSLEHLADSCRTTPEAARVTARRLIEKKLLHRASYKDGRGGWTDYELPEEVYGALFQSESRNKVGTNPEQSGNKPGTQPGTQPGTTSSSSSSKDLDLNKLTNTGDAEVSVLPPEWSAIDTTPIVAIRFGRSQLVQLHQLGKLTSEQVQESIYAFAFDLEVNAKSREINGAALNYFMGILRKGPYAPPGNYEPPEIRQMRLYMEAKEREQKVRLELENRLEAVEFEEWATDLPSDDKTRFVPPSDFAKPGSPGHNAQLREYFRENVWPERKECVLKTKPEQRLER